MLAIAGNPFSYSGALCHLGRRASRQRSFQSSGYVSLGKTVTLDPSR
jgi:hypothetical protein